MSERPFMQLYVSDFVGDTLHLSAEQVGAYMLLLMAMWNADGVLPDDDSKLARVARMSLKKWRALKPELMEFFTVSEGHITHGRLARELQKSERQTQSRAAAGARGGAATALKNNKPRAANAAAMPQHLPEPYRKERATLLVPTESSVRVDRRISPDIFDACVLLTGEKVKGFIDAKSFPAAVYSKALENVKLAAMSEAATEVSH